MCVLSFRSKSLLINITWFHWYMSTGTCIQTTADMCLNLHAFIDAQIVVSCDQPVSRHFFSFRCLPIESFVWKKHVSYTVHIQPFWSRHNIVEIPECSASCFCFWGDRVIPYLIYSRMCTYVLVHNGSPSIKHVRLVIPLSEHLASHTPS